MTRTFIEVPLFSKRWKEIGLGEDELQALQIMLLKDPESGPVMEGTGGIRKVRFPLKDRGKSGSVRVCYTDFAEYEVIYLITAFEKKEQDNLTDDEKNVLKKLGKALLGAVLALSLFGCAQDAKKEPVKVLCPTGAPALAILGAVLSIIAPNRLSKLADKVQEGLVINQENVKIISENVQKSIRQTSSRISK